MRSKVLSVGLTVGVGFLLVTNPVMVHGAALISGKDIKNESVTSKDIKNGSLKGKDFKAGQLPAGTQGPPGATGPAGPSDGYMNATGASSPISSPAVTTTELARLSLPAGSYMVSFDSTPYTAAASASNQNAVCFVRRDTTVLADTFGQTVADGGNGNVDFVGLVSFPAAADLVVACYGGVAMDWYRNRLTAIKVGTATGALSRPGPAIAGRATAR